MLVQLSATAYAREPDNEENLYPGVFIESIKLDFHVCKSNRSNQYPWPNGCIWYQELRSNIHKLWLSQDPAQYQQYCLDSDWEQYIVQIGMRVFHRVFIQDCNPGKQLFDDGRTIVDHFRGSSVHVRRYETPSEYWALNSCKPPCGFDYFVYSDSAR